MSRIRATRASPPGLAAASGARRGVFGAALEQFDALHGAAQHIVPAASPLLLFYALSQSGRALAAATISQSWRPAGHGLTIKVPAAADAPLGDVTVHPTDGATTSFRLLCDCLGSAALSEPVTLSALWAANPHAECVEGLGLFSPRAVGLSAVAGSDGPTGEVVFDRETVPGLEAETGLQQITEWLQPYPAARGAIVETQRGTGHGGGPSIRVRWEDEAGDPRAIDEVAPFLNNNHLSGTYLRPALNANDDTLSPLAVWFATLLALSSLARYHPERWTRALNRNRSTYAIPIEESLDVALEILPWLLLAELTRDRPARPPTLAAD